MKEVKITVNGKEYKKTNPMIKDWKNLMEYQSNNREKNLVLDEEPMKDIIKTVAEYVEAPMQDLDKHCPIDMIMEAFRAIDSNIVEAFTGVNSSEKNAQGRKRPEK